MIGGIEPSHADGKHILLNSARRLVAGPEGRLIDADTGEVVGPAVEVTETSAAPADTCSKCHPLALEYDLVTRGRYGQLRPVAKRALRDTGCTPRKGGGRRGRITGFSPQSRRRLRAELASLSLINVKAGTLVTLTYGSTAPDMATARHHFELFRNRLKWKFPTAAGAWRLEVQQRGAPHWHLLVLGAGDPGALEEWTRDTWFAIVGSNEPQHRQYGVKADAVRCAESACAYLAKQEKDDARDPWRGRRWGRFGNLDPYRAPERTARLSRRAAVSAARILDHNRANRARLVGNRAAVRRGKRRTRLSLAARASWFARDDTLTRLHDLNTPIREPDGDTQAP